MIEFALDQGYVRSKGHTEPLSEVELELKQGHERDLYEAALQLTEAFPIAIEHVSKAERGYRLYRQQLSPLIAPAPLPVSAGTDQRELGYWLACLQYGERLLLERDDPQGVDYLRRAAKAWHKHLTAAGQELGVPLRADLCWLVNGLRESKGFAETRNLVAAPRYSRLLLRLGAYLAD